MRKIKDVRIFYSWQSDSPRRTNLDAIREALKIASEKIVTTRPRLRILRDEATRDTPGSPNIALKILEKIEAADVFVADITTITPTGAVRPCPNPNVSYELGYAVGHLGWDRVILLFNKAFGSFPSDLPFDLAQQRVSPYELGEADPTSTRKKLAEFLEMAIAAVLDKNPKRPAELRGLSREKRKHDYDLMNMQWLMSTIHLPTLDHHILELPDRITDRALWFWEHFEAVVDNSLFSIYDPGLKTAVKRLYLGWRTALSHDEEYDTVRGGNTHVFTHPMDLPLSPKHQKAWNEIESARTAMRKSLDDILERLRAGYIEIDLHKTNADAWKAYVEFQRYCERAFGDARTNAIKRRKQTD